MFSVKAISYGKQDVKKGKRSSVKVDGYSMSPWKRGHYIFSFNMTTGI